MSPPRFFCLALLALPVLPLAVAAQGDSALDTSWVLARARSAQQAFESRRRLLLPSSGPSRGRCDERIGRFCYWYDDGDTTLPAEPARVVEARARFLAELELFHRQLPGDDWVLGQRVRYLVEHGDTGAALAITRSCGPGHWWCEALAGFARHAAGRFLEAEQAFDRALETMPDPVRCEWTDWTDLLDGRLHQRFKALPCDQRGPFADSLLWLGTPLLSRSGNDLRTELFSRRVIDWMLRTSRSPQGLPWGRDVSELVMRYGWPVRWTVAERTHPSLEAASVVGHDPSPAFPFLPTVTGDSVAPWRFDLRRERPRARYAPAWGRAVRDLETFQIARFPRGDSILIVFAAEPPRDTAFRTPGATLAAAATSGPRVAASTAVGPSRSTGAALLVMAPADARVAGIEAVAADGRQFARARVVLSPLPSDSAVTMSDLLLFRTGDALPTSVAEAAGRALPSTRWRRVEPVGVYWEIQGPGTDSLEVAVAVTPERRGLLGRIGQTMTLVPRRAPLTLRWVVGGTGHEITGRAFELDLARLSPGRYTLELAAASPLGARHIVHRSIELLK